MKLTCFYYTKDLSPTANILLSCCYSWRNKNIKNYIFAKALGISKSTIVRTKKELIKKGFIFENWALTDKTIDLIDKNDCSVKIEPKKSKLQKLFDSAFDKLKNKS